MTDTNTPVDGQIDANSQNTSSTIDSAPSEPTPDATTLVTEKTSESMENNEDFVNPITDKTPVDGDKADSGDSKTKTEIEYTDFVVPENIEIDVDLMDRFVPIAKEIGLTQEQAQKFIDLQIGNLKATESKHVADFEEAKKAMRKETLDMLGGDYKQKLNYAARALTLLPENEQQPLKDFLNETGVGNNPLVVSFFIKVGQALSEDKFVGGKNTTTIRKPDSKVLFGDMVKK